MAETTQFFQSKLVHNEPANVAELLSIIKKLIHGDDYARWIIRQMNIKVERSPSQRYKTKPRVHDCPWSKKSKVFYYNEYTLLRAPRSEIV